MIAKRMLRLQTKSFTAFSLSYWSSWWSSGDVRERILAKIVAMSALAVLLSTGILTTTEALQAFTNNVRSPLPPFLCRV